MDLQIILFLVILLGALVLFSIEIVPVDVVALALLLSLILTGLLPIDQAFLGFGSDTFMFILGLLILSAALMRTGVVEQAGRILLRHTGNHPNRLYVAITVGAATLSAFMSNTASTAFFLPVTIGLANRARVKLSKLLLPLAFAAILSSSVSLVSTSTNIVVSGLITQYRLSPIGMFEMAPVGIPIAVIGLIYMYTIGRKLIPDREQPSELADEFGLRPYLTEVLILPKSPLIGKTLEESGLGRDLDLTVVRVVREKHNYLVPTAEIRLEENDVLLVEGLRDQILKIKDTAGISIEAEAKLSDPDQSIDELSLAEVILLTRSPLIGRRLRGLRFRERFGLQVLAINRMGEAMIRKISQIPLRMGDMLLVQGNLEKIRLLEEEKLFHVLGTVEEKRPNLRRAPLAVAIFVGVLLAATFEIISLPIAMLLGSVLAFLSRCITPEEAYREIEWKVLILIGCMLALGVAMERTGTAQFIATQIVSIAGNAHPLWLLTAFFVVAVLLTQPMSNQAAAVVVVPIAIQTALQLGLNPRTFAMMIAVAASCSFITPLEPSCLLVYGPGHYRFMDFFKVGAPLTVIIYLVSILLVPMVWPL